MKIAFHVHPTRLHWKAAAPTLAEQEQLFGWVSRQGFDGVDISDSWPFDTLDQAGASRTRALAADHGLAVATVSGMGKTLCHPELGERNLQALERALDTAGWLDAQVLNVALAVPRTPGVTPVMGAAHSPGGSLGASDGDFAITAQRLRRLARMGRERGMSLSIEMHDRSLADTSTALLRILDEVGEPNVGANPDLCNGYRAYAVPPESWADALRRLAPRTNLWHVNNLQRVYFPEIERAAFVERPLGEGDIDYRLAVKMMQAAGFTGWTVIEYKGAGDAFETLAQGQRYFRQITRPGDTAA
ncbi:sugar phosphate isomerase/epimerase [Verticiella sediminum]|uniref:Sugar phosphate isomerase/epimerase n=1 Tax=Verticiella sediminum TaxID=1247510 RepID=A0A556AW81_9BURK|nr:sugar phosphate isomerase/epimerase family protein [Verticiella sediminum]TSH96615.1 sugar phosphate isomerase/epimerase [Verticiella sediminum]